MSSSKTQQDIFTVELWTCPVHVPFFFACHPWFVLKGPKYTWRYEILFSPAQKGAGYGYIYINHFPPYKGLRISTFTKKRWPIKKRGTISGTKNSVAEKLYHTIINTSPHYPYKDDYQAIGGPNSNSYVQWILDQVPEANITLPFHAFGKNFHNKNQN